MTSLVAEPDSTTTTSSTPKALTPGDFVNSIVGKSVVVKLNSGVSYHGVLACLDGFMNLALEQCEEYVDGQRTKSFGDCFIRGNNGKFLGPTVIDLFVFLVIVYTNNEDYLFVLYLFFSKISPILQLL